jgi:hypothetical protein
MRGSSKPGARGRRSGAGGKLSAAQRAALGADAAATRFARSRGAIDLALGETLLKLFEGDRLAKLGYARQVDYARERLGVSPRAMFLWLRLARGLQERPLLRRAVVAGTVTPRGEEPPGEAFQVESLWLRMTPAQQDRLDAALALARETLGPGAPRWQCLEAICQEWLGTFGAWLPKDEKKEAPAAPALRAQRQRAEAIDLQLRAITEAVGVVEGLDAEAGREDARALDATQPSARSWRGSLGRRPGGCWATAPWRSTAGSGWAGRRARSASGSGWSDGWRRSRSCATR